MNPFLALRDHAKEVYDTLSGNERIKERTRGLYDQVVNRGVKPSFPMLLKDPQNVTMDDLIASGFGVMPMTLKGVKPTQYSKAHETAQRNAALPVEQGGLGLPPDNTAMDRARAMGFDTEVYHGSSSDIESINTQGRRYIKPFYTTADNSKEAADFASKFADTKSELGPGKVYPLITKSTNIFDTRKPGNLERLQKIAEDQYVEFAPTNKGLPGWGQMNNIATGAKESGIDSILMDERDYINSLAHLNPQNIRSRFAAFDPFKRNSADILATGIMGSLLLNELKNRNAQDQPRYR